MLHEERKTLTMRSINDRKCGKPLRALYTKLLQKCSNGITNHYGKVKSIKIGQSAVKLPKKEEDSETIIVTNHDKSEIKKKGEKWTDKLLISPQIK